MSHCSTQSLLLSRQLVSKCLGGALLQLREGGRELLQQALLPTGLT